MGKLATLSTTVLPIGKIKPYFRNPRGGESVGAVIESIKKFGYCQPILVDAKYVIIAGHSRYKALQELGYDKINVVIRDLPPKLARQYRLIDNSTNELGKWKRKDLVLELREFENLEKDFQVFFKDDLASMMDESTGKKEKNVTKDKVDRAADKQDKKFTNASRVDQIEIECPCCEETFFLNRKDLLKVDGGK